MQERSSTLTWNKIKVISLSYTGGKLFIMYNEVTANLAGSVSRAIGLEKPQLLWLQGLRDVIYRDGGFSHTNSGRDKSSMPYVEYNNNQILYYTTNHREIIILYTCYIYIY